MPLSPGSQIAGYQVVSLLGSGGMGEVYLVENPHLLRREALKVISLAGAHDPDFQKRFTNEARTTAALDHPHIISIHQYGINADGTPWFTMNYLEGTDLAHGSLSPADVVMVTSRVGDALDYAHRRNIVHRDVKPANIIVSRDDQGGIERVTVLDFGIAKLVDSTSLTATSAFIGTLAYCAPEVIEGHDASAFSDQYSLACTVYQLLTGHAPFKTTTPSALVMAHLTKTIPQLSSRRPDLAALDPVLARAFAKNPAQRYPDCRSFAAALSQTLNGTTAPGAPARSSGCPRPPIGTEPIGTPAPGTPDPGSPAPGSPLRPNSQPTVAPPIPPPSNPAPAPGYSAAQHPSNPYGAASYPGQNPPAPTPGGFTPMSPTAAQSSPFGPTPTGGQPPSYPMSHPNQFVGGGFSQPVPVKKKHTGLILTSIAAAAVIIVLAAVGIAFATGTLGTDAPTTPTAHPAPLAIYGKSSCGISNKQLYCWGANYDGQLGNGSVSSSTTPARVNLTKVTAVGLGGYTNRDNKFVTNACAVSDGQAYCWGANNYGQLGNGTTTDTQSPTRVTGLSGTVTVIATGFGTSCAIADGKVFCWGDNDKGQIGVESVSDQTSTPVEVTGISGTATAIATSQGTTCVSADTVYCWGDNDNGQLGTGATTRATTPQQVDVSDADSISVGSYAITDDPDSYTTVCASAKGKAYCWGDNRYGQIGDGTKESRRTPTPVGGLGTVTQVSTGWGSSCAVSDATVYCWGDNQEQQLGTGASGATSAPTPVTAVPGTVDAVDTAQGTSCARVEKATIYCWGINSAGQVGNGESGDDQNVSSPARLNLPA